MPSKNPSQYLSVTTFANETGLSRAFGYELVARGEIPSIRIGDAIRMKRSDVDAYLASRPSGAASEQRRQEMGRRARGLSDAR